jgi:hypothetical protein
VKVDLKKHGAGSPEHSNDPPGFINGGKLLGYLRDYYCLKEDSIPSSYQ